MQMFFWALKIFTRLQKQGGRALRTLRVSTFTNTKTVVVPILFSACREDGTAAQVVRHATWQSRTYIYTQEYRDPGKRRATRALNVQLLAASHHHNKHCVVIIEYVVVDPEAWSSKVTQATTAPRGMPPVVGSQDKSVRDLL